MECADANIGNCILVAVCSLLAGQERHRILVQSLKLQATEAVRKNTKHFAVRSWCTVIYIVHLQTVKFYNIIRAHCTSNAQHSIYMYVCVYIHTYEGRVEAAMASGKGYFRGENMST